LNTFKAKHYLMYVATKATMRFVDVIDAAIEWILFDSCLMMIDEV